MSLDENASPLHPLTPLYIPNSMKFRSTSAFLHPDVLFFEFFRNGKRKQTPIYFATPCLFLIPPLMPQIQPHLDLLRKKM